MELICVAVRDRKAEFFFPPFFCRTRVEAIRNFERLMQDPNRTGATSDYEIVAVGKFDDQTGQFSVFNLPELLVSGADFKQGA